MEVVSLKLCIAPIPTLKLPKNKIMLILGNGGGIITLRGDFP